MHFMSFKILIFHWIVIVYYEGFCMVVQVMQRWLVIRCLFFFHTGFPPFQAVLLLDWSHAEPYASSALFIYTSSHLSCQHVQFSVNFLCKSQWRKCFYVYHRLINWNWIEIKLQSNRFMFARIYKLDILRFHIDKVSISAFTTCDYYDIMFECHLMWLLWSWNQINCCLPK